MKVAMIGPYPTPGQQVSGGVERVIDTLIPTLAHRVALTLIVPGASKDADYNIQGVRIVYLKRAPGPGAARYWSTDAWRVGQAIKQINPDIVHLQGVAGVGSFVKGPCIFTAHGIVDRDFIETHSKDGLRKAMIYSAAYILKLIEATARRRIGNIIVINPYVMEALRDIEKLETFHIPNPVDPLFFDSPNSNNTKRERRIISVGHIGPRKNTLETLLIAVKVMANDPTITLTVCGNASDKEYEEQCRALIRAENLEHRIDFAGNLSAPQLLLKLDSASCLLMTSRQETAPMAIAEAHARGVAAIAPADFGIRHMITPTKNGFFLPDGTLDAQAAVLRRGLDCAWDRAAISQEARSVYDPERIAKLTVAAYRKSILSQR